MTDRTTWLATLQRESFDLASATLRSAYPPERRMADAELAAYLEHRAYAVVSTTRADGRAHAAPSLFVLDSEAFWLPTLGTAVRVQNVRAHAWLALSVVEGDHDEHAAVLTEGPAEVLTAAPESVTLAARDRNDGGRIDWATAWLRMTPARLYSFAAAGWRAARPHPQQSNRTTTDPPRST